MWNISNLIFRNSKTFIPSNFLCFEKVKHSLINNENFKVIKIDFNIVNAFSFDFKVHAESKYDNDGLIYQFRTNYIVISNEEYSRINKKIDSRIDIEKAINIIFFTKRTELKDKGKKNYEMDSINNLIDLIKTLDFDDQNQKIKLTRLKLEYLDNQSNKQEVTIKTKEDDSVYLKYFLKCMEPSFEYFEKNVKANLLPMNISINTKHIIAKEFLRYCNSNTSYSESNDISRRLIALLFVDIYELSGYKFNKDSDPTENVEQWFK
jgi:hypothetical protein